MENCEGWLKGHVTQTAGRGCTWGEVYNDLVLKFISDSILQASFGRDRRTNQSKTFSRSTPIQITWGGHCACATEVQLGWKNWMGWLSHEDGVWDGRGRSKRYLKSSERDEKYGYCPIARCAPCTRAFFFLIFGCFVLCASECVRVCVCPRVFV